MSETKNADLPAMPTLMEPSDAARQYAGAHGLPMPEPKLSMSLTKREYFAAIAMQGLMASDIEAEPEDFADSSVQMADALLKALDNKEYQ